MLYRFEMMIIMGYYRCQKRNRKYKKLYDETKNSYGAGAYYDEKHKRYIKYSCGGIKKKYLKRLSSKKARKYPNALKNCGYKKTFDYRWELY